MASNSDIATATHPQVKATVIAKVKGMYSTVQVVEALGKVAGSGANRSLPCTCTLRKHLAVFSHHAADLIERLSPSKFFT